MLARCFVSCGLALASMTTLGLAQSPSPNGVKTLNPPGAISTGSDTWSVGARAGDLIFVAGMQGIDPVTNKLVDGNEARIRHFLESKTHCPIRGRDAAGLRPHHGLRIRPAPLRPAREQGTSRTLGQAALSAAHHVRGAAPVRRRYHRDRQCFLRADNEVKDFCGPDRYSAQGIRLRGRKRPSDDWRPMCG